MNLSHLVRLDINHIYALSTSIDKSSGHHAQTLSKLLEKTRFCACIYNPFVGVHHLTQSHNIIPYSWGLCGWILAKNAGSPPLYNTSYTGRTPFCSRQWTTTQRGGIAVSHDVLQEIDFTGKYKKSSFLYHTLQDTEPPYNINNS